MTPLESLIRGIVASEGPMRLDRFMSLALGHPQHGYYMKRDPFGETGDFITAPEVSQVFGELVGVWCAAVWQQMGSPPSFNLVELGPGRGTLMSDVLRAAKVLPGFAAAARVHLVEMSPTLRAVQRQRLGGDVAWHGSFDDVPDGPTIVVANEFFDAIPIRQFEFRGGKWFERVVGCDEGGLRIGLVAAADRTPPVPAREGDVFEFAPARADIARQIGRRLAGRSGAALFIDYGHASSALGDTLQAMRAHAFVPVTEAPGDCDLTSHVDFEALAKAVAEGGAAATPAMTQRDFLLAMGLDARFAKLSAAADAPTRDVLARAKSRLADRDQMGNLFKVLAAVSPRMSLPYPFGPA